MGLLYYIPSLLVSGTALSEHSLLSPLLTPISGWVNPPLYQHEYCNFTCLVSYHLDSHQLDLGSYQRPYIIVGTPHLGL